MMKRKMTTTKFEIWGNFFVFLQIYSRNHIIATAICRKYRWKTDFLLQKSVKWVIMAHYQTLRFREDG
jgi:hypothetical protein